MIVCMFAARESSSFLELYLQRRKRKKKTSTLLYTYSAFSSLYRLPYATIFPLYLPLSRNEISNIYALTRWG